MGAERTAFAVLAVGVVASSLAFSSQLVSFLHAKELVLGLTLVAMVAVRGRRGANGVLSTARDLAPLVALLAVQGAVALVHPPRGWERWTDTVLSFALVLALVVAAGGLLAGPSRRQSLPGVLVVSAVLVGGTGLLQYAGLLDRWLPPVPGYTQRMYSVFGNQDLLGGYAALGLVLAAALLSGAGRGAAVALGAALLVLMPALAASGSRSAWLAAAAGLAAGVPWRGGRSRRTTGWLAVSLLLAGACFGGLAWDRLTASFGAWDEGWRVRLWLWDGALRMWGDAPLLGVGAGNHAWWSARYLGEALLASGGTHAHNAIHTLHAHSEPLELAAETGLAGVLLAGWFLWRLRRARGAALGGLVALGVFACLNPAFHSAPHLLAAGLLSVQVLAGERRLSPTPSAPRRRAAAFAALAVVVAGLHAAVVVAPGHLLCRAEDAHLAGAAPETAYPAWVRRVSVGAARGYAISLMEHGRHEEARAAWMEARRGLDTGEVYWCLAKTALSLGRNGEARGWLNQCGARWPLEGPYAELAEALARVTPSPPGAGTRP